MDLLTAALDVIPFAYTYSIGFGYGDSCQIVVFGFR